MSPNYFLFVFFVAIILVLTGLIFSLRKKIGDSKKDELENKDDRIVNNLTNQISLLSQTLGTIQKSVDQRLGEKKSETPPRRAVAEMIFGQLKKWPQAGAEEKQRD